MRETRRQMPGGCGETDYIRMRRLGEVRRISVNARLNFDYRHDSSPFLSSFFPDGVRFFGFVGFVQGFGIGWMSYVKIRRFQAAST